jgi:hypothetical protein
MLCPFVMADTPGTLAMASITFVEVFCNKLSWLTDASDTGVFCLSVAAKTPVTTTSPSWVMVGVSKYARVTSPFMVVLSMAGA